MFKDIERAQELLRAHNLLCALFPGLEIDRDKDYLLLVGQSAWTEILKVIQVGVGNSKIGMGKVTAKVWRNVTLRFCKWISPEGFYLIEAFRHSPEWFPIEMLKSRRICEKGVLKSRAS